MLAIDDQLELRFLELADGRVEQVLAIPVTDLGSADRAIERRADGWRTNVSRGGRATATTLPAAWADLAVRAARAVGAEYAGVDLLPADDGTVYVLEVNGIPGWEGLQGATGIDVAGAVVEQLLQAGRP